MHCSQRLAKLSYLAIIGTAITVMPVYANEPHSSLQKSSPSIIQKATQPPRQIKGANQTETTKGQSILQVILDELFGRLKRSRTPKPATTRGGVCPIAPGLLEAENRIFSDRPLFIWQGEVDKIKVFDFETDQILWEESIPLDTTAAQYGGAALQPSRSYIWSLERSNQVLTRHFFEVMPSQERKHLLQERIDVDNKTPLPSEALKKANYFSEHALWSDMFNALKLEQHPTIESKLTAISQGLCSATESPLS